MQRCFRLTKAALGLLCALSLGGAEREQTVTVYVRSALGVPGIAVSRAARQASRIFAAIGVAVEFKTDGKAKGNGASGLELGLEVRMRPPDQAGAGALASTHPFSSDGTMQVYYERIRRIQPAASQEIVLAYVLAHEVAHTLQGFEHHSTTGLMKAQWNVAGFLQLASAKVQFDPQDVEWIRAGIVKRIENARKMRGTGLSAAEE